MTNLTTFAPVQIPFGISFRGKPDYTYSEVSNFIECADGIEGPNNFKGRYIEFLESFLSGKVKKSTLVDVDVLALFIEDLENRADIDYREGHWDDEPDMLIRLHYVAGGKYFASQAKKLKFHMPNAVNKLAYNC